MNVQLKRSTYFLVLLLFTSFILKGQETESEKIVRPFQITFVTPLGTNGWESPEIINHLSINLLAGVSGGVQGAEFGGFFNFVKGDVYGLQMAGMGNYASGILKGPQFGGVCNIAGDSSLGAQFAGIANIMNGPSRGGQFSGIVNYARGEGDLLQASGIANVAIKNINGGQITGITNVAVKSIKGTQIAGINNVSVEGTKGAQIAGIANYNGKEGDGPQIAGIVNSSRSGIDRVQVAGIVNYSENQIEGVQIAGIANYTKKLSGVQIGLVNVCDTLEKGFPIGLISVVKHNGYFGFELETNESFYLNATYKMGVEKFYNIFTVGFHPDAWGFGYGVGTIIRVNQNWGLNIDAVSTHINEDKNDGWTEDVNLLNKIKVNIFLNIGRFKIYGGPSVNIEVSGLRNAEGELTGSAIQPSYHVYRYTNRDVMVTFYPGFNIGIGL